jgi:hypothetical protein
MQNDMAAARVLPFTIAPKVMPRARPSGMLCRVIAQIRERRVLLLAGVVWGSGSIVKSLIGRFSLHKKLLYILFQGIKKIEQPIINPNVAGKNARCDGFSILMAGSKSEVIDAAIMIPDEKPYMAAVVRLLKLDSKKTTDAPKRVVAQVQMPAINASNVLSIVSNVVIIKITSHIYSMLGGY